MRLAEWLQHKKMTHADFAAMIRVERGSVTRYANGRVPRPAIMAKISSATDGVVTANDFMAPPEVAPVVNECSVNERAGREMKAGT